ncbi:hypothetical protein MKP08_02335 [Erythrobacter sp. LQ02-29]|uniref:hypothetical protein n=1 Tax=Erythrobacter sp. LQ02-29 TaxID=2920384 RepID=UPI001F4E1CA9|nr:hypothetical protein [Erythrobacter sp. LQ02-29]MCP9221586.1 hypothetical protein [Erythrobacter sp. LQ02-29]
MSDPVPDSTPKTRWIWVALIVLLAVGVVAIYFNADGDTDDVELADSAVTTQQERLNQDLPQPGEPNATEQQMDQPVTAAETPAN